VSTAVQTWLTAGPLCLLAFVAAFLLGYAVLGPVFLGG
jgi:hypothetical protein